LRCFYTTSRTARIFPGIFIRLCGSNFRSACSRNDRHPSSSLSTELKHNIISMSRILRTCGNIGLSITIRRILLTLLVVLQPCSILRLWHDFIDDDDCIDRGPWRMQDGSRLSSIVVRIGITDEPQQIYGGIHNRLRCEEIVSLEPCSVDVLVISTLFLSLSDHRL
jgi:hypothetical protein